MKKFLFGQIATKIFAFYGKSIFLVKIDQKSRQGCVRSEHILQEEEVLHRQNKGGGGLDLLGGVWGGQN